MAIKICLDAGHDGKYNRSSVVPAYYESDFIWKLYVKLKKYLEEYGIEVTGTRANQNVEMGTKTRGRYSKGHNAFFSLHANWAERESADHVVIYEMLTKKQHKLAVALATGISEIMGTKEKYDIRTKAKDSGGEWYGVLQGCEQVDNENGFILEHSFYSNKAMATWMMDDSNIDKLAKEEAKIIAEYFGVDKKMVNTTTTTSAEKVVQQARDWLGRNEADGSHREIIDIYNSHKPLARGYTVTYTDAWCATFVSAVSIKLGYTNIIPTECGCSKMITLFQNLGSWVEDDSRVPNPGDILFYDWQDSGSGDNTGSADHVGIVESVNNGIITIIEGNYSNSVKRRQLEVNGKNIRGYGVPKYDTKIITEKTEPESQRAFQVNDLVSIQSGAKYTTGSKVPSWVIKQNWYIKSISGDIAIINQNEAKNNSINSPVYTKDLILVAAAKKEEVKPTPEVPKPVIPQEPEVTTPTEPEVTPPIQTPAEVEKPVETTPPIIETPSVEPDKEFTPPVETPKVEDEDNGPEAEIDNTPISKTTGEVLLKLLVEFVINPLVKWIKGLFSKGK